MTAEALADSIASREQELADLDAKAAKEPPQRLTTGGQSVS